MTKRVFFRKGTHVGLALLEEADMHFCVAALNDESVTRNLLRRFPLTHAEEREWILNLHKRSGTDQVFGIALIDTGELLGTMGLHRIDWISRTATTAAWIASPEHQGKGFGSEAKMLLLEYAFNTLGLRKINSHVLAPNKRSRKYNERCGYRIEASLKHQVFVRGKYVDELCMALFEEDFPPLWKKYCESTSQ
jgi:RimJ/RimL family protein N-acetyltransferase